MRSDAVPRGHCCPTCVACITLTTWNKSTILQFENLQLEACHICLHGIIPASVFPMRTLSGAICRGVKFHDGAPWNAQACVDNLKQVFTPGLKDYHGWYDLPKRVKRWEVRHTAVLEVMTARLRSRYCAVMMIRRMLSSNTSGT